MSKFVGAWLLIVSAVAGAQEPIRFPRTPDVSPDGKRIVFSYLGDLWTVEAIGGVARPITMHEAHDINPCYSPDGRSIAFSSNRFGSYDVFVVAAPGGKPRRLTFDSAQDMAIGWSPDGKNVLFTSNRGVGYPAAIESYSVPVEGGPEKKVPYREAKELAISASGAAFTRGSGSSFRMGYRGSSNDDLWLGSLDGTQVRRLTDFAGQDTAPMWSADGRTLYYVSEVFGTPGNIVRQEMKPGSVGQAPQATGKPKQLTFHKEEGVRKARISADGGWIVYECGMDVWIVSTVEGSTPRMLAIEVNADEKSNFEKLVTFTKDATEYALSPDDGHIAFVVHGEIFLMPAKGGKATRLTNTAYVEHGVSWSPDGKKLLYAADKNGREDLFLLEADDPEHPELTKAHRFRSTQLTDTPESEWGANFAPDGSKISFLRAGKLLLMKPDGSEVKPLVDTPQVFDYDWSGDSKHVVYARRDGSGASELYILPADGSEKGRNITRYATYNEDVSWNNTGNKIAFTSNRTQQSAGYVINLQKPQTANASPSTDIDWDDIHLRTTRPGNNTALEGTISRNGRMYAYRAVQAGDDLWLVSTDGSFLNRMTTGGVGPRMIRWSRTNSTVWFLDASGSIRNISVLGAGPGGTTGTAATVAFTAKLTVRKDEEFAEMFEQAGRALSDSFYDSAYHGRNWNAVREKYRPIVKHIALKEDLYSLVSLMTGELNASHLGISGSVSRAEESTADLGMLFDESYTGPGLKIAEVLKHGPADRRGLNLKVGELILAIDRQPIDATTNLSKLLNGKAGEPVTLDVAPTPTDKANKRRVEVTATERSTISNLMYQRWIAQNAERVSKLSNNTIGYIHIPSMDEAGLEQFVRSLYSDNFDKDAILIDVRNNGGGFTHDQVLNYLGAKEHTFFRQRDGGEGLVLRQYDRKWTRPLAVLMNQRSYSDAEIFPNAVRTLGLGKLIGQPTGGMVIGTTSIRLIDGSQFRTPRTGVFTVKGVNMEKEGVAPDYLAEATPEELAMGLDAQIIKGVEVLTKEVAVWKKSKAPAVGSAPAPNTGSIQAPQR